MERSVVEMMEGEHDRAEEAQKKGGDVVRTHPHPRQSAPSPSRPGALPSLSSSSTSSVGDAAADASRYVEIAKLGPMGICGEDILLSPCRRYTLASLTPVWLYEVRAADLLRVFDAPSRAALVEAVAHTQRVRERHALVKNRTRLQHHAAPTLFRHFLDDNLQRNLTRQGAATAAAAARAAKEESAASNSSPARQGRGRGRGLRGHGAEKLLQGGAEAVRAVLHDLDHIHAKQRYARRTPARIEALVKRGSTPFAEQHQGEEAYLPPDRMRTGAAAGGASGVIGDESKEQIFLSPHLRPFGSLSPPGSDLNSPVSAAPGDTLQVNVTAEAALDADGPASPISPSSAAWRGLRSSLSDGESVLKRLVRQRSAEQLAAPSVMTVALNALENARAPAGAGWAADAAAAEAASLLSSSASSSGPSSGPGTGGNMHRSRASSTQASSTASPEGMRRRLVYDPSPFSLHFREGSVLEKSGLGLSAPSRGGAVGLNFSTTKQHVTRGSIVPLRVQNSAVMILGEGQIGADEGIFVPDLTAAAGPSKSRRRTPSMGEVAVLSPTNAAAAAARKEGVIASAQARALRPSASLPALASPTSAAGTVPTSPTQSSGVLRRSPSQRTLQARQSGARLVPLTAHSQ
jgi:hypothetical protein